MKKHILHHWKLLLRKCAEDLLIVWTNNMETKECFRVGSVVMLHGTIGLVMRISRNSVMTVSWLYPDYAKALYMQFDMKDKDDMKDLLLLF